MQTADFEKQAFILAFSASIWKRIWRCMYVYCDHQKIDINTSILLKCFKYNLLCPTGIVNKLLPYLEKAIKNGFLMPKEYENNEYVKRAIRLFAEAYKISKNDEKKKEKDFILNYASSIYTDNEKYKREEISDILNFPEFTEKNTNKHTCSLCELIEAWDISLALCTPRTELEALMQYNLLKVLEN